MKGRITSIFAKSKERITSFVKERIVIRPASKFEKAQRKFKWTKEEVGVVQGLMEDAVQDTIYFLERVSEEEEEKISGLATPVSEEEDITEEVTREDSVRKGSPFFRGFTHAVSSITEMFDG